MSEEWTTGRLALRRFTLADEDAVLALHSDPAVMAYITGGRPSSRQAVRERTLPEFLAYPDSVLGVWAVSAAPSVGRERGGSLPGGPVVAGSFLGWVSLRPTPGGDPELGYRFHRATWGRGYATEAARALVDRAFAETSTARVWATTMAVNTSSRRVLERVGLRHVRTYYEHFDDPIPGTEHGEVEYALTRAEWLPVPPLPQR